MTMSFSLCAVIAEASQRTKPKPIPCGMGSGQCFPAMHGLTLGAQVALLQSPIPPAAAVSLTPWRSRANQRKPKTQAMNLAFALEPK
jgi:hypothetical protein